MHNLVESVFRALSGVSPLVALIAISVGMMLESMCIPIPSEMTLVMAGLWAAQGKFSIAGALAAVTLGALVGSSIAYAVGFYLGKPAVERFGKYILLTPHRLEMAEQWLYRFGPGAIFLGRLMFGIRALISLPSGILRLSYRRFILFTFAGCLAWNVIGVYLGYRYGLAVEQMLHNMSVGLFAVVAAFVLLAGGFYFYKTHFDKTPLATPQNPGPDPG